MSVNIDSLAVQMSLEEVQALVKQKEKNLARIAQLQAKKAGLQSDIADIESEIASLSVSTVSAPSAPVEAAPKKKAGRPPKAAGKKRGRPAKKTGKKRGRPAKAVAAKKPGRPPKEAPKRRGRPPKAKTAKAAGGKRSGPTFRELAIEALKSMKGEAQLKEITAYVSEKKTGDANATASLYTTVSTAMRTSDQFANVGRGRWKFVG